MAAPPLSPELLALLTRAVARFPTPRACAKALGISPRRLTTALHTKTGSAFDAVHCLRLAELLTVPPLQVLRAAGHGAIGEDFECFFRRRELLPLECRLLDALAPLSLPVKHALLALVQAVAGTPAAPPGTADRSPSRREGTPRGPTQRTTRARTARRRPHAV